MRAAVLHQSPGTLVIEEIPSPCPGPGEVRLRVHACGVCRTDLHVVDGELENPKLPLVPGHQIVGIVEELGERVAGLAIGDRVGVPWLGSTCGTCRFCLAGQENLCDRAIFTGYTRDGGYAEETVTDHRFCFPLPPEEAYGDLEVAPLLCAGLIGFRCLRFCGEEAEAIGFYGFGAAAHILTQVVRHQGGRVYAFTRPGDNEAQDFAKSMGAHWAGDSDELPPEELDAAIIFAPVGALVPAALRAVRKGGTVVCGGIHMSDIPGFPYSELWGERRIVSIANLTREDGREFLALAPGVPLRTRVTAFPLAEADSALRALREGAFTGAAVVIP